MSLEPLRYRITRSPASSLRARPCRYRLIRHEIISCLVGQCWEQQLIRCRPGHMCGEVRVEAHVFLLKLSCVNETGRRNCPPYMSKDGPRAIDGRLDFGEHIYRRYRLHCV